MTTINSNSILHQPTQLLPHSKPYQHPNLATTYDIKSSSMHVAQLNAIIGHSNNISGSNCHSSNNQTKISSLTMSQLSTVYATKRRRRNGKSLKPPPKDGVTKSNPSKRHRERLNAELDLLASLLPFEQNILSKLDRLSILRLAVSYLRTKSYFQVVMHKEKEENGLLSHMHHHDAYRSRELSTFEHSLSDGDMFLQALNGFLMILTCDGEVFFATHSIESYLGFHQSDIVHQSVYELVHSEDREELQRQLLWNSFLPADAAGMPLNEALSPDKSVYLERSFTVRFRCLLDNTSGFLRLDIRGRVKILHGQNRKTEEPPLGLFAYCTPFGPPSLMESIPQKENMFKSKHKLDLSLVSMDQRGKMILGYSDGELATMGGYSLVHFDDLAYVASAHQELLKTGASGMIAYRYQKKDGEWQWLQTSSRLVYKNSKPDFVISTHRQLMEEEGKDLLGKRTMDFKVSYLDTGLASTYFSEADQLVMPSSGSPNSLSQTSAATPQRPARRYKTQLRDFLSTCRSKRKLQQAQPQHQSNSNMGQITPPTPVVEYIPDAAAISAAYTNLNPMYATSPYPSSTDNLYMTPSVHSSNFYPVTENLYHQYRLQGVSGYYPGDYHHSSVPTSYVANGFLPYDSYGISTKEEKWQDGGKYYPGHDVTSRSMYSEYGSPTGHSQIIQSTLKTPKASPPNMDPVSCSPGNHSPAHSANSTNNNNNSRNDAGVLTSNNVTNSSNANVTNGSNSNSNSTLAVTPKMEPSPPTEHYERQTVLMWGTSSHNNSTNRSPSASTPTSNGLYPTENSHMKLSNQIVLSPSEQQQHSHHNSSQSGGHMKWSEGGSTKEIPVIIDVGRYQPITLSIAQQRLHGSSCSPPPSSTARHHIANLTAHTAVAYPVPSNAYIDHANGSPLLSLSEVTNTMTLLNQ
ncbi:aryl hydrocarbon receptor protein 1 isoform X3 [Sitodiplosis mosellana]|uniref:aryl hydrocarbon receptor protein 1 isoform X3 n=1 Tax=Sitodiplosis mosellana TaxID=263140 RepID=UPI0024441880|nr:aryl hydrocarbon receptor protein 1 isoform X3 [Sitodiplosis mosellana]XP_055298526.1 aryl hydrocarbon receptor protein 1 isoform X3 [Sitodiplosis mosellana]